MYILFHKKQERLETNLLNLLLSKFKTDVEQKLFVK